MHEKDVHGCVGGESHGFTHLVTSAHDRLQLTTSLLLAIKNRVKSKWVDL